MADPVGAEIVVEQNTSFSTPKRSSRVVKPTSEVRDTARQLEDTAKETKKSTQYATRTAPAEEQIDRPAEVRKSSSSSNDGRARSRKRGDPSRFSLRSVKCWSRWSPRESPTL
ncbi:hypothetical protein FSOLCH5_003575 [Fusarium solani]